MSIYLRLQPRTPLASGRPEAEYLLKQYWYGVFELSRWHTGSQIDRRGLCHHILHGK